ncbi:lytic polysaccharide monooxygenase [Streptomyces sp. NPDC023998]|uniref:lytic polysaccharide monooxygenase auxiliary activity family 9 protein n=1 Tax=Streptomyces sp. NPDC023998 TaxID=3154597 RepID=UPI0033F947D4
MTHHRIAAATALAGVVPLALTIVAAGPARAHGAPTDPVSRVAACSPEGSQHASAACRAAVDANGGAEFEAWDNLRVADVRGRDREFIPDGQLCSAGLDAYAGLDIARKDWPATPLKAGADFTLTYQSTIPHKGTFSLYLTKQGYDPGAPLRWDDLAAEPFATVTDPELKGGAYRISGRLPADLTGRHVLYTVWRNSSTPDTYYSCSDVVMQGDGAAQHDGQAGGGQQSDPSAQGQQSGPPAEEQEQQSSPPAQAQPSNAPVVVEPAGRQAATSAAGQDNEPAIIAGGAAAVLALVAVGVSVLLRRRAQS